MLFFVLVSSNGAWEVHWCYNNWLSIFHTRARVVLSPLNPVGTALSMNKVTEGRTVNNTYNTIIRKRKGKKQMAKNKIEIRKS